MAGALGPGELGVGVSLAAQRPLGHDATCSLQSAACLQLATVRPAPTAVPEPLPWLHRSPNASGALLPRLPTPGWPPAPRPSQSCPRGSQHLRSQRPCSRPGRRV